MAKLAYYIVPILLMVVVPRITIAQSYQVRYTVLDSALQVPMVPLQKDFSNETSALEFLSRLVPYLQTAGYIAASVDSIYYDTTFAAVQLYIGKKYQWAHIATDPKDESLLQALAWNKNLYAKNALSFTQLEIKEEELLNYLEERGYPFGKVYLDSIKIMGEQVAASLKIDKGPLYRIDSIRLYGDATVSNSFLQRYLDIPNGSIYDKRKLANISTKLSELPYVEELQPATVSYLATGSVLNLYLKQRKTSQVNLLAGFLPNPDATVGKKFNFTIDANILLRNSLGGGEAIGLNWQKLQPQSQRLNLLYEQPYVFSSPFGLGFHFDMFRKDSTFLNIDMRLSATYGAGQVQSGSIFLQRRQSIVNGVNTVQVLFNRQLPPEADVRSTNLGFSYQLNNTDYRLNPRRGNELSIISSAGLKRIKKNNQVIELEDPGDPSFKFERLYDTVKLQTGQVRIAAAAAHYMPVGKQAALKGGIQAGLYSSGNIYRNEAFQIGGYRLLRGFDEESQYVSQYAVGTLEYRILLQRASHFFVFADGGWARHIEKVAHTYLSTGGGLSFETKAGIFNLVLALGSRDDQQFNLRQSKVHFGFVNYF